MNYLETIGKNAKKAFEDLKAIKHKKIKKVLENYNQSLLKNTNKIIRENLKDVKNVKRKHLVDRLILNKKRIEGIRHSINEIAKFKNPIGRVLETWRRPNNLIIKKITTSIGVIGVIYESRPNVTADVAALCLKSGNCSILRGGSEAFNSNRLLANLFRDALRNNNINQNCVQFIENTNRKIVDQLLSKMSAYVDVIVPRGGKGLVARVQKFSNVHVIGHLEGMCHIYVDKTANLKMAKNLILNAKMRRTSICGAVETILINEKIISSFVPKLVASFSDAGCEIRCCENTIGYDDRAMLASDDDWSKEYLAPIVSVKSVADIDEAITHIENYGTGHTESVISENKEVQSKFTHSVDSAIVMINASTQFADGGEFGLGGEIGIATGKFHARGPVGVDQLTSFKYIVKGNGHIRD